MDKVAKPLELPQDAIYFLFFILFFIKAVNVAFFIIIIISIFHAIIIILAKPYEKYKKVKLQFIPLS